MSGETGTSSESFILFHFPNTQPPLHFLYLILQLDVPPFPFNLQSTYLARDSLSSPLSEPSRPLPPLPSRPREQTVKRLVRRRRRRRHSQLALELLFASLSSFFSYFYAHSRHTAIQFLPWLPSSLMFPCCYFFLLFFPFT